MIYKRRLKTPITYYGGKQKMLTHILPLIPEHQVYTESFAGGLAVFWGKAPSAIEVVNDQNAELVNFYRCMQTQYMELKAEIEATLHSRFQQEFATIIYDNPTFFPPVKRAWAVWVLCTMSFASNIKGGFAYGKKPSNSGKDTVIQKTHSSQKGFDLTDEHGLFSLCERLRHVQVECNDALKVISSRDSEVAFHYIDPPYVNTDQGHYAGYTEKDFSNLLSLLSCVQGKFLLSCFDGPLMREAAQAKGWRVDTFTKQLSASKNRAGKTKVECLVRNY